MTRKDEAALTLIRMKVPMIRRTTGGVSVRILAPSEASPA